MINIVSSAPGQPLVAPELTLSRNSPTSVLHNQAADSATDMANVLKNSEKSTHFEKTFSPTPSTLPESQVYKSTGQRVYEFSMSDESDESDRSDRSDASDKSDRRWCGNTHTIPRYRSRNYRLNFFNFLTP